MQTADGVRPADEAVDSKLLLLAERAPLGASCGPPPALAERSGREGRG
jgi:hypothetical protein